MKTLMPELRFPEFLDAAVWKKQILKEYLTESRVKGSKGDIAKKITVKLWGKGVYAKNDEIKGSANTQYYRRSAGQFIYSKLDFLNQAFGMIPQNLHNYESTVDLPCFDMDEGINPIFLLEYVQRKEFYERLGETADGSRKAKRIHADTFLAFSIFMPSVDEQKKIADCLSSIDDLITAHTQKHDALKAHKKGLLQQLFPAEGETVPKLRFPEFLGVGEWIKTKLGKITGFSSGGTPSKGVPEYWGGEIPWISASSMHSTSISNSDKNITDLAVCDGARTVEKGTLLLLVRGSMLHKRIPIGITETDVSYNQDVKALILKKNILEKFLLYLLIASEWRLLNAVTKTGIGAGKLDTNDLNEFPVFFPSDKGEQQKIANSLSSLDNLITAQSKKIESLKSHKKGLMQQLFPAIDEEHG